MLPLMDMMAGLESNGVTEQIKKNFDLSQQQAEQAIQALMPAYSSGLKHNVSDPMGFASFVQAVMSGQHQQYADIPQNAFKPAGINDGNNILGHLFGNKAVSRAIATQAAAQTGIDANILEQLMPALAPIIMGGMYKQMTGQMPNPNLGQMGMGKPPAPSITNPMAGTPFGDMMDQFMISTGMKPEPKPEPVNPWESVMGEMMTAAQAFMPSSPTLPKKPKPEPTPAPTSMMDNPFSKMFEDMMAAKLPDYSSLTARLEEEQPVEEPEKPPLGSGAEMFGSLLDAGTEIQQDYQKSIDKIFNDFFFAQLTEKTQDKR